MCRWFLGLPTLCLLLVSPARGDQTFPYKAYVTSGEVYVRSGPGKNYYPTSKLKIGDAVNVYRHDPGGWFAIRPPSGSFTWVSARYLEKSSHGLAKVVGNEVAARVGSEFSDIRDVIQVRLHRGEVVEILDSKEFRSGPEAGTWYKVAPPSGEFRWIAGKFVDAEFPHDGVRQSTAENNPLIHPTVTVRPEAAGPSAGPAWPPGLTARRSAAALAEETADPPLAASTDPRLAGGGQEPSAQDVAAGPATGPGYASRQFSPSQPTREISPEEFQAQLDQLNSELAVMLVEEPSVWKFDELGLRARDLVNQAETAIERGRAGNWWPGSSSRRTSSSATIRSTISRRRPSGKTASLPKRFPPAPPADWPFRPTKDSTARAGWRGSSPRSSARRSTPWWTTRTT